MWKGRVPQFLPKWLRTRIEVNTYEIHALMEFAGLEPERLRLDWVSASEGERFARIATEFTETVRALGPCKWKQNGMPFHAAEVMKVPDAGVGG